MVVLTDEEKDLIVSLLISTDIAKDLIASEINDIEVGDKTFESSKYRRLIQLYNKIS